MARFILAQALVALSSLVAAQSSSSQAADGLTTTGGTPTASSATATINGTTTIYSVAFTVPAAADIGPVYKRWVDHSYATSADMSMRCFLEHSTKHQGYAYTEDGSPMQDEH